MFLNLINNKRTVGNEKDGLFWKGESDERYTVKANVNLLEGVTDRKAPYKLIWNSLVPSKVSFFMWEVWWGKILTMEHLKRRGFQLASKCLLCRKVEENMDHLLLHCPSIWDLWEGFIHILGVAWVCPRTLKDLMEEWSFSYQ